MTAERRRPLYVTPAGLLATLVLFGLAALFVRLGFWQLDRLEQRRARNAAVAERLDAEPVPLEATPSDTAGLLYRRVRLEGTFDEARSIVWAGRSFRGSPGVHLLTPLRLDGSGDAVLVDRGWLPSPDAATVHLQALPPAGRVELDAVLLPLPSAPDIEPGGKAEEERTWFRLDAARLREAVPYPIGAAYARVLPAPDAPDAPRPVPPPSLSEGSHFSYALQWFGFAAIAIFGWAAVALRRRPAVLLALAAAAAALLSAPAGAQLRPLDPLPWSVFEAGAAAEVSVGVELHDGIRASLAGVDGRLWELGTVRAAWRYGRGALVVSGTSLRLFEDDAVVAPPVDGTEPPDGRLRVDAGDWRIATALRLTPRDWPAMAALHFGTRLPTTDDRIGLERDRLDFFALLGGRVRRGGLAISAEAGVAINGTRLDRYEQSDVLVYALVGSLRHGRLEPRVSLVGQVDGLNGWTIRGNEDRGELRLALRYGDRVWVEAGAVTGLTRMGPDRGLRIAAGALLGGHDGASSRVRPVAPPPPRRPRR